MGLTKKKGVTQNFCLLVILMGVWGLLGDGGKVWAIENAHSHSVPDPREPIIRLHDESANSTLRIVIGPINLSAETGAIHIWRNFVFPFDAWFVSYTPKIIHLGDSEPMSSVVHHIDLTLPSRDDLVLPRHPEVFFTAGKELRAWPAIKGYGYPVTRGKFAVFFAHLVNPTSAPINGLFIEVQIAYQLVGEGSPLTNVRPVLFSSSERQHFDFDLKPGFSLTSKTTTFPKTGRLVAAGGHIHDYGKFLLLENLSKNQTVVRLEAQGTSEGSFRFLPVHIFPEPGYAVHGGDEIRITSAYESLAKKTLEKAGMGIIGAYFVPSEAKE